MGHVKDSIHVAAPPQVCWDIAVDPNRLPEWQAGLIEVKDVTGRQDHPGASYTGVYRIAGRNLDVRFEVIRADKPTRFDQKGSAPGGGTATATTTSTPSGTGTDVTFEMEYELPGGFVGNIADKLFAERAIERQIRHSNENFKALCEAAVAVHA